MKNGSLKRIFLFCAILLSAVLLTGCLKPADGGNFPDAPETKDGQEENTPGPLPDGGEEKTEDAEPGTDGFDGIRFYIATGGECDAVLYDTVEFAASMFASAGVTGDGGYRIVTGDGGDVRDGDIMIDGFAGPDGEDFKISVYNGVTVISSYGTSDEYGGYHWVHYGLERLLMEIMTSEESLTSGYYGDFRFDTEERILMLDCARKKWSVGFIKDLISEMSWMGYNSLELHITEEQGMRFNIWEDSEGNRIPDCNGNDFSALCGGSVVSWNTQYSEDVNAYYNRDEITDIMTWAQKNHIRVIPAVDLPGHSFNLINRADSLLLEGGLPFSYGGTAFGEYASRYVEAMGSGGGTVNIAQDYARNLSYAVCDAYAAFFGEFGCTSFNICGDEVEVSDSSWTSYAAERGGNGPFDAFIIYMNSLASMLKERGYRVRAYNDYVFSRESSVPLDPDIDICFWNASGIKSPSDAALEGRGIYNCIESYCYYVLRNNTAYGDARDGNCSWWAFHHSTPERIYSGCRGECGFPGCTESGGWDPSKVWEYNAKEKTAVTDSLRGGYFLVWGDWAKWDTEENILYSDGEYNLVDRMWSNITKMTDWDADSTADYETFAKTVGPVRYSPLIEHNHS